MATGAQLHDYFVIVAIEKGYFVVGINFSL
jgi:hypothetical protein